MDKNHSENVNEEEDPDPILSINDVIENSDQARQKLEVFREEDELELDQTEAFNSKHKENDEDMQSLLSPKKETDTRLGPKTDYKPQKVTKDKSIIAVSIQIRWKAML